MLRLRNFVVSPGNRPGQRDVYARCSDGTLRKITDEALKSAVLLRYDASLDRPSLWDRLVRYFGRWHRWYVLPIVLILMWLVKTLGLDMF